MAYIFSHTVHHVGSKLAAYPFESQGSLAHAPRQHRTIFALIIINKAGGLVYNKNFHDGLNQISTNDYLVLAGTFHG